MFGFCVWVDGCVGKRVGVCGEGSILLARQCAMVQWSGSSDSRRPRSFCAPNSSMQHSGSGANLDSLVLDPRWRPPGVALHRPKGSQGPPAAQP
jgi:hypothetical protein